MSSVFSAAEKWDEPWYGELSIGAKVLYDYLYDTADIAGFKPQNFPIWSAYTGLTESEIEKALEELKEVVIIENDLAWLKDHLKFNHNTNIKAKNNAREKIRKTYVANKNHKSAFSYYSTLLDSTLFYSTEPLNQGFDSGNKPVKNKKTKGRPQTTRSTKGIPEGRSIEVYCLEHPYMRLTHKVGSGSIDKFCEKCKAPMVRNMLKSEMNGNSVSSINN